MKVEDSQNIFACGRTALGPGALPKGLHRRLPGYRPRQEDVDVVELEREHQAEAEADEHGEGYDCDSVLGRAVVDAELVAVGEALGAAPDGREVAARRYELRRARKLNCRKSSSKR